MRHLEGMFFVSMLPYFSVFIFVLDFARHGSSWVPPLQVLLVFIIVVGLASMILGSVVSLGIVLMIFVS